MMHLFQEVMRLSSEMSAQKEALRRVAAVAPVVSQQMVEVEEKKRAIRESGGTPVLVPKSARNYRSREERVRRILERKFNTEFAKVRPDWLRNPFTGKNLELDMYSPVLNIAVEYNGQQHYQFVPKYHKKWADLQALQQRDALKRAMCAKKGVCLIEIPYWIDDESLEDFIVEELAKNYVKQAKANA